MFIFICITAYMLFQALSYRFSRGFLAFFKKFCIALATEMPFPLYLWHKVVGRKDERGDTVDYIDLLNGCIPNKWFQISRASIRASGYGIEGRLRREAGTVASNKAKQTC